MSEFDKLLDQFKKLMDVLSGKANIRDRISLLLNPVNPQTSSKLNSSQVDYVRNSLWISEQYPEFEPLKKDALELAKSMLSHEGWGVEKTINLEEALTKQIIEKSTIEKIKDEKEAKKESKKDE